LPNPILRLSLELNGLYLRPATLSPRRASSFTWARGFGSWFLPGRCVVGKLPPRSRPSERANVSAGLWYSMRWR